jgi:hypothetical protein
MRGKPQVDSCSFDLRHGYAARLVRKASGKRRSGRVGRERCIHHAGYLDRPLGRVCAAVREAFADDPLSLPGETGSDQDTRDGFDDL